jgi:hypothetical protein
MSMSFHSHFVICADNNTAFRHAAILVYEDNKGLNFLRNLFTEKFTTQICMTRISIPH